LQVLCDVGFAGSNKLCIAEPLGYFHDQHILVQAEAAGVTLFSRLAELCEIRTAADDRLQPVRLTGKWLAKLHAVRNTALRLCSPVDDTPTPSPGRADETGTATDAPAGSQRESHEEFE